MADPNSEQPAGGEIPTPGETTSAVYRELRRLAEAFLRQERPGHTLQPTALVNEAFVRLADKTQVAAQGHERFIAVAAETMRRVLVDHARSHNALKRGGPPGERTRLTVDGATAAINSEVDVLALDDALRKLALLDERHAKVVELKFFGGLSVEQIAGLLGIATRTVEADWALARAWLRRELGERRNDIA